MPSSRYTVHIDRAAYDKMYEHVFFLAQVHAMLFAKRYRIVFEIHDIAIYIYDIQDCRQDADKSLV